MSRLEELLQDAKWAPGCTQMGMTEQEFRALLTVAKAAKETLKILDNYHAANRLYRSVAFPARDQESYRIGFWAALCEVRKITADPFINRAGGELRDALEVLE